MERNDILDLLRSAGVPEDRIDEDAIRIAAVVADIVMEAVSRRLADKIVALTSFGHGREEDAVDYQAVTCRCGYLALRFNQVPLTECPKCGKSLADMGDVSDAQWPDVVG